MPGIQRPNRSWRVGSCQTRWGGIGSALLTSYAMPPNFRQKLFAAALAFGIALPVTAQVTAEEEPSQDAAEVAQDRRFNELIESVTWNTSGAGELGELATLEIPSGYRFTGSAGTLKLMEAFGNLTSGAELGYLAPATMDWFAVFEFDDCGYAKTTRKTNWMLPKS